MTVACMKILLPSLDISNNLMFASITDSPNECSEMCCIDERFLSAIEVQTQNGIWITKGKYSFWALQLYKIIL